LGDPNTGGGLVETPPQHFFYVDGQLLSVNGSPVTPHEDHDDAQTANGSNFFNVAAIPVNFFGNPDTCGHTRAGTENGWFIIQS
jgi:uncharacterized Zn-binding protein involved in type VI secretion